MKNIVSSTKDGNRNILYLTFRNSVPDTPLETSATQNFFEPRPLDFYKS